ncbi:hypothetical protein JVU11DRAFT_2432 [Chiua virens]|nr:hypothetical protein JVU11DRAFT_2432 [Chiua virens]
MIIADEDDPQKIKDPPVATPTVRYPDRAASRPFSTLPDYETSQALALGGPNDSLVTLYKPPRPRRCFDSRFWKTALTTLVVYVFLTLVIAVPIIIQKQHQNQPKYPFTYSLVWPSKNSAPYDALNINNITSTGQSGIYPVCNNWTEVVEYFNAGSTFVLASTERYVSPNGQFSLTSNTSCESDVDHVQGAFYVGINPNQSVQDAVISIVMQSSSPTLFSQTFTCFAITNNFTDLSFYVPNNLTNDDNILYNVSLLFPQTATPSRVTSFSTILPLFDQQFTSLDGNVLFDELTVVGPVSRVSVDSISANRILVDTSLEPITGTFSANASLVLSTVMAPISANISLYNDPSVPFPTTLDVHTGNSNLTVDVTVFAPNENPPSRPNFVANVRTFSGFLSTNVLHQPNTPQSVIQLHVINDLGPTDVVLDNLFQGLFQVTTKQGIASVSQGSASVPDPWVPNVSRAFDVDFNTTSRKYGWIGWGNPTPPWNGYLQGEAVIDTSLANVTLSFLG